MDLNKPQLSHLYRGTLIMVTSWGSQEGQKREQILSVNTGLTHCELLVMMLLARDQLSSPAMHI